MEKMTMCRICLVENVRMHVVDDKDLHEVYETLTDVPFVTEDRRPMVACFICFAKLKQCCQLQRKCLEAEELFTQMMNEPNTLVTESQLNVAAGVSHIEGITVKIEPPDVYEGFGEMIDPKEEQLSEALKSEWRNNNYSDAEDIPAQQSESDSEDDVPLMEIKTEVEKVQEVPRRKRRVSDTTRAAIEEKPKLPMRGRKLEEESDIKGAQNTQNWAPVAKKPRLKTRRTEQENDIIEELKRTKQSDAKVVRTTENCSSKHDPDFEEPSTYRKHYRKKSNTRYLKHTTDSDDIDGNQRPFGTEKRYKCDICLRNFAANYILTHIRTHTGEKPYKCDFCQTRFNQKSHLNSHIRTHTGEKPFKCEICQRKFKEKNTLTRHIRTHTGEKPYKCIICQRSFRQRVELTAHNRTHTGEKPFECDFCQRCFNQKGDLTSHLRTHTGEKPYKCDVCKRCFSHKHYLLIHSRIHTGEKPYNCDICQHSFRQKPELKKHVRTHTGEKPFKCDICQRSFCQKAHLTRHNRMHFDEKPHLCTH